MNNNLEIIPGILEQDWSEIEKKLTVLKPYAKIVHIDIIDGKFAPDTTFLDAAPFRKYSNEFFFELHMMVDNPIEYVEPFANAGFKRFLGHIEKMPDQNAFIQKAKEYGEAGLVIDQDSSFSDIAVPLENLDEILVMTIKAGASGQKFDPRLLKKVEDLRHENIPIGVDGGINDITILLAKESGATRFVSTSYLFESNNPQGQFEKLKNLIT